MKKTIMTAAIAMMALTATTASADRLARNNVACATGSVWGFTVQGANGLTHYVQESDLGRCPEGTVGVPPTVDIFKSGPVVEWLATQGIEITDLQLERKQTEHEIVVVRDDQGNAVIDSDGNEVTTTITTATRVTNGGW